MKTLKDLTPEILAKIPLYQNKAIEGIFDGKRYENFELHNTKTMSIQWGSLTGVNMDCFYVNGRYIDKTLFQNVINNKLTFTDFQKLTNEDEKAAVITIIKENNGQEAVLKFLNAQLIEKKEFLHINNYKETIMLFKTINTFEWANDSNGNKNVKLAWVSMNCPSTGQNYLIECCPTFTDVEKAVKWLRPNFVPTNLNYIWQSAN